MKNQCQKNTLFSTPFFLDFSSFWPPKTEPKSSFFRFFFENVDFVKISKNHWKNNGFSWFFRFRGSKNPSKIDARTRSKKAPEKNIPKIDFGLRSDFPKLLKIDPTSKKIEKNGVQKKAPKKRPWALPHLKRSQAFWDPTGPSNHLSND